MDADSAPQITQISQMLSGMTLRNRLKAPHTLLRGGLDDLNQGAWKASRIEKSWLVSIRGSFFKPLLSDPYFYPLAPP
jgi:hypothetical protein